MVLKHLNDAIKFYTHFPIHLIFDTSIIDIVKSCRKRVESNQVMTEYPDDIAEYLACTGALQFVEAGQELAYMEVNLITTGSFLLRDTGMRDAFTMSRLPPLPLS